MIEPAVLHLGIYTKKVIKQVHKYISPKIFILAYK